MAPWRSIELGFQLGVHVMFGMMGFAGAVALVGLTMCALWAVVEWLKP